MTVHRPAWRGLRGRTPSRLDRRRGRGRRSPWHSTTARVWPHRACSWSPAPAPSWRSSTRPSSTSPSRRSSTPSPGRRSGDLSWVLNAYNIVFAAFLIVFGRLTDLVGRRRVFVAGVLLFTVASLLCAVAPSVVAAGGRAGPPGSRRGHARAGVPGPRDRGVPRRPAGPRDRPLGSDRGRRRRTRTAHRRRPGRARRLALGVPDQPPVRAVAVWAGPPPASSRAGLPGVVRCPTCRARPCWPQPWRCSTSRIIKGGDWGWTSPAAIATFAVDGRPARRCSSAARGGTARRCSTRRCCGSRPSASPRRHGRGRASASSPTCSPTSSGSSTSGGTTSSGRSGAGAGRARRRGRRRRLGPLADRHGYRLFVVPGAVVWAGAYLWYHQQVGTDAGVLGRVAAGPGPQRHRCRGDPPAARQCAPWPPCRAGATPPPPPSCPAPASWAACSASRSWS